MHTIPCTMLESRGKSKSDSTNTVRLNVPFMKRFFFCEISLFTEGTFMHWSLLYHAWACAAVRWFLVHARDAKLYHYYWSKQKNVFQCALWIESTEKKEERVRTATATSTSNGDNNGWNLHCARCAYDIFHYFSFQRTAMSMTMKMRRYCVMAFHFSSGLNIVRKGFRKPENVERPHLFSYAYNVQFCDYQNDNIRANSRLLFFSFLMVFGSVWFGLAFILFLLKSHHARIFSYSVEFNLMKFHPIDYWWYSNALTKYVLARRLPIK